LEILTGQILNGQPGNYLTVWPWNYIFGLVKEKLFTAAHK